MRHIDPDRINGPRPSAEGDRVATIRFYFFCPDVVGDICSELGLPWRSNGYRYRAAE